MTAHKDSEHNWHIAKAVPATVLVMIIIQAIALTVTLATKGATIDSDIKENTQDINRSHQEIKEVRIHMDDETDELRDRLTANSIVLARIEESLKNLHNRFDSIEKRQKR